MKLSRILTFVPQRILVCCGIFTLIWFGLLFLPAPSLYPDLPGSSALYDKNENLISLSLSKDEKYRLRVHFSDISKDLIKATLQYEDRHFFYHYGFNPFSIARAAIANLINPGQLIGASTITMQLVRMRTGFSTRSVIGKLKQIFLAVLLERKHSKQEILEAYLNQAPYGANIEGIETASLIYFRKQAKYLNVSEAVTLSVLPQHPALRWKKAGREEFDFVRATLSKNLSNESKIIAKDFEFSIKDIPKAAPHFFQRVLGSRGDESYYSSIDTGLQQISEETLRSVVASFKDFGVRNGTVLIAELPAMKVRAYVGSVEYANSAISGYVNGIEAKRSPGSLLKPFVYALALEQGGIVPESLLFDVPINLSSYKPENFERNFLGPISAKDALIRSRNIPALELFRTLQPETFFNLLKNSGVQALKKEEHYGIALVLGGLGTSSEEIAEMYGILGNLGEYRKLEFQESTSGLINSSTKLLSKESSYLVLDMLSGNPPALSKFKAQKIPWKTGTSYGSRDAWAAGVVGKYIVVVWLGEFDGRSNANLIGRDFAGPVFFSLADRLQSRFINLGFNVNTNDLNLKKVKVCSLTGSLPTKDCPHTKDSWFVPGVSPISLCQIHKRIYIDPSTGFRMCPGKTRGEGKVFEVWDSNMQQLFLEAGLKRVVSPEYDPACGMPSANSNNIRIVSPEKHLEYFVEQHRDLEIELLASVPGDSRQIYWFANENLISSGEPSKAIYWKAKPGKYNIKVVDDRGRSKSVEVKVRSISDNE